MRNSLLAPLVGLLIALAPTSAHAFTAQGSDEDFLDLSIEQLLQIRVPSMTSVQGGHVHNKGEWMPMFHYMHMSMDGMRDGTDNKSTSEVLTGYPVTPTEMDMDMFMFGLMYAPTDRLTLMGMVPYMKKSMDHVTGGGARFNTRSEGLGDTQLTALYVLNESETYDVILNAGISVPTGSTHAKDANPASGGVDVQLPYPMQLGSGTYDLMPGITYVGHGEMWEWGAQAMAEIPLGKNDRHYSLGDRYQASVWAERRCFENLSTSVRVIGQHLDNIDGADRRLGAAIVPTADPHNQGGTRVDVALGLEYYVPGEKTGTRVGIEFGMPALEDLDGPQMSTEWWLALNLTTTIF